MSDAIISVITYLAPLVGLTALAHSILMSRRVIHRDMLHDINEQLTRVERDLALCEAARQQYYRENIELLKRLTRIETSMQNNSTGPRKDFSTTKESNGPICP